MCCGAAAHCKAREVLAPGCTGTRGRIGSGGALTCTRCAASTGFSEFMLRTQYAASYVIALVGTANLYRSAVCVEISTITCRRALLIREISGRKLDTLLISENLICWMNSVSPDGPNVPIVTEDPVDPLRPEQTWRHPRVFATSFFQEQDSTYGR